MDEREKMINKYNSSLHKLGRITLITASLMLIAVPIVIGLINKESPDTSGFINGFLRVGAIYIPVAIVEFLVYAPMLGVGGSYLSFLTGNVTNMKIPCVMNSKDIAKTEAGSPEHEIISTISVATSAIVTTLVVILGVILMTPLQPVIQSEVLIPAFDNVVPALFGALGIKYFIKSPKIAAIPLLLMTALCIFVPSMINQTSILLLPSGALALVIGFLLFKKGKL